MIRHQYTAEDRIILIAGLSNPAHCERREQPSPISRPPGPGEDDRGPKRPDPDSAQKDNLLKRMRKVDPKQAERYRQRTGE
ncbi:MAG: ubiquitin-like protein UBact [Nitrospirales bacterium]|nr:ubiquitin-like protein UBact [Nitrospira sp.]MDR4502994.1 ubiquitin-like protein UBact [Nitrospirales bacterium]